MIEDTLKEIRRLYQDESLFLLSQFPEVKVEAISTGSLLLDQALGVGGIPRGRYTEIYGVDYTGKTSLCQHIVANAQKLGLTCAYIDVENSLDLNYMELCGVDMETLYIAQPDFAEEALGIAELLIKSGDVGLVVIDSVAALSPEKESEDKKGEGFRDKNVTGMLRAKLLNAFFRRTAGFVRKNKVAVVFTNQMRDNVGSFFGGIKPTGGRGIKHYASIRISLSKKNSGLIKSGTETIGQEIEAVVKKNKVACPYGMAKFSIISGMGIDKNLDILTVAEEYGIVERRGAYYRYNGETIAKGKLNTLQVLNDNPELINQLEENCKEVIANG